MIGQFRTTTRSLFTAWFCGCWVVLSLLLPLSQALAQQRLQRNAAVDLVSAAPPASTPYSDTSLDESSLRLIPVISRIDAGGDAARHDLSSRQALVAGCSPALMGRWTGRPTLLDLGVQLRL